MCTQPNVIEALREAEAALELAIKRILKRDPGHHVEVTSEAKALVSVRQALQCQGCDVPKDGVYQISEPSGSMPLANRALMLSVATSEPAKGMLKECAARIAELEAQLAAAQQGVQREGRADSEIVERTEAAARFLLEWKYGLTPEADGAQLRHSKNAKAQWAWEAACKVQEIITDSDAVNAAQEVDDEPATHPTQQGLEKDAARYRWLREQHNKGDDTVSIFIGDEQHGPGHLDAQVDVAMIAAQAKQGGV